MPIHSEQVTASDEAKRLDFTGLIDADLAFLGAQKEPSNTMADCVHMAIAAYVRSVESGIED